MVPPPSFPCLKAFLADIMAGRFPTPAWGWNRHARHQGRGQGAHPESRSRSPRSNGSVSSALDQRIRLGPGSGSAPRVEGADVGGAYPPLRQDALGRRARVRGAWQDLSSVEARRRATEELFDDVYAASTRNTVASKIKTAEAMIRQWGLEPYPPSSEAIVALGAALKAGAYASAVTYISVYRVTA